MSTKRPWGSYKVLEQQNQWAVKELTFNIGMSLSNQRHLHRSEHWHVVEGTIQMDLEDQYGEKQTTIVYAGKSIDIPKLTWHKATNIGKIEAKVIEVWMGTYLNEDDIQRRD